MLAAVLVLVPAAQATGAGWSQVAIDFGGATANREQHTARTVGIFTMTGRFADAGTISIALRSARAEINGTATLIGMRGIFTIGLRGTFGDIVDNRESIAGRWTVRGGTGAYRRLRGHGHWNAVADFGAAPAGMMPPTLRGALLGRLSRGSPRAHARLFPGHHARS